MREAADFAKLGETLRPAGYTTFATGKWHNRPPSFIRSFDRGKNVFFGGMSDHTKVPIVDVENGVMTEKRTGEAFSSTLFADAAVEFLEGYDSEKPFSPTWRLPRPMTRGRLPRVISICTTRRPFRCRPASRHSTRFSRDG